jgi:hypothetical protein
VKSESMWLIKSSQFSGWTDEKSTKNDGACCGGKAGASGPMLRFQEEYEGCDFIQDSWWQKKE